MFRIGEFSKFSRVSVKMLRHYDEIGLLKPARVDPESDYRYYAADQLAQLNRILVFKDMGFSLEQIAQLLEEDLSTEQVLGMLRLRQAQVERELRDQQARLAALTVRLEQIESEGRLPPYEVVLKQTESQLVASLRFDMSCEELGKGISKYFHLLERHVQIHNARASAAPMTLFHEGESEETAGLELLVPIKFPVPQTETIRVLELPGVPMMASVVHTGSYACAGAACRSLGTWIKQQGYRVAGPWREVYLRFGAEPVLGLPAAFLARSAAEFVTEYQLPVELG